MNLEFDLDNVTVTEFGVGRDADSSRTFFAVPVDADVQAALREMVGATWGAIAKHDDSPTEYEPSEKHGAIEALYLPLDNELAASVRELHQAGILAINAEALAEPAEVFCYFSRLTDRKRRRLTALRRATQFKGVLKSRNRLVQMLNDSLRLIDDNVFKLDSDFDLLVDSANVHILRPSGFEFAGKLRQAILDAVPKNIEALAKELSFVALDGIETYAAKHPRAARYLASIRGQAETKDVDKALLMKSCKETGVEVIEKKGKLNVVAGHEMGFLEVLDRRRYEVSLVRGKPEHYRAASRKKIDG